MSYRVDWFDNQSKIAKVWGFNSGVHAYDKFVEGVRQAYDEVCFYDFTAGPSDPVLLARFYFNNGRMFHHGTTKVKIQSARREENPAQIQP